MITRVKFISDPAAAAKSCQSCPTLFDPIDGSLPSLGFSRQEHWSGLPFPSPMHESEKWKWSRSVMSDCLWPHGLQPTRLLHPWDFPGKSTGVGCHYLLLKPYTNQQACSETASVEFPASLGITIRYSHLPGPQDEIQYSHPWLGN